jgi:nitrous oxidase accessory protein NosD
VDSVQKTAARSAAAGSVARTIVVHPGQSIQAAVDRAAPGDTVLILPGHYRQSVLVAKDHLRIRGSGTGPGGTVIEPPAHPSAACADSGICVLDPAGLRTIVGTRVDNLEVRNFEQDGVVGVGTRGLVVRNVKAWNNDRYGITKFNSTGGQFLHNVATGSEDAGIYIGDSPMANTFIAGNDVWNNGFGILARNAQHTSIQFNNVHDNCIGIFVWWLPGVAGESNISFNTAQHNNRFCARSEEVRFNYSGSGIALMGAHDVVVQDNSVLGNRGGTRVSGGIVVLSGKFDGGPVSTGNTVRGNTAFGDAPADIVNRSGGRNTFRGNFCTRSIPDGLCRS